jgi:hypothetical protein
MTISPVRAAPSRAWRWKLKSVAGAGAAGADGGDAVMAREVEQRGILGKSGHGSTVMLGLDVGISNGSQHQRRSSGAS